MFDVIDYRVRCGLQATDTTKDAEIRDAINTAIAIVETYLDRKITWKADEVETLTQVYRPVISLRRYPIGQIQSVTLDGKDHGTNHWTWHRRAGLIQFNGQVGAHEVKVEYSGGYSDPGQTTPADATSMPADLVLGITKVFDEVWSAMTSTGGTTSTAGAVRSIKVGSLSIQYDTGTAAVAMASSGFIPLTAMTLLDRFQRRSA